MRELGSSDSGVPLTELQFLMSACKASMPRPVDLSIIFSLCQLSVYYRIHVLHTTDTSDYSGNT